jgi:hypothetical protein
MKHPGHTYGGFIPAISEWGMTHKGPAFRTSRSDAIADAAWQAITSLVRSNKHRLKDSIHYHLPYRKKDQFKAYGVRKDIPRMEMVHHQM